MGMVRASQRGRPGGTLGEDPAQWGPRAYAEATGTIVATTDEAQTANTSAI
jgi:hypothetical protein